MAIKALLLAAGYGTRLKPYTDLWPKCLMPINGKPLLEIWIDNIIQSGIDEILINIHHHKEEVTSFLSRDKFKDYITWVEEDTLNGTAGTLLANKEFFKEDDILLVHSDNLCSADLKSFISFHYKKKDGCIMTMMTFTSESPRDCGIVEIDSKGVCIGFHEKVNNPPSNLANGAVYLLDNKFLKRIEKIDPVVDFSLDIIPNFLGEIQTWKNTETHLDIGTIKNLLLAQNLKINKKSKLDDWQKLFSKNKIHRQIKNLINSKDGL